MSYSNQTYLQAAYDLGFADGLSEAVRSMNTGVPITIVNRDEQLIKLSGDNIYYPSVMKAYGTGKTEGLLKGIKE